MIATRLRFRIAALAIALVATSGFGCGHLLFFPSRELRITPSEIGVSYDDVFFESADGTHLHGWWLPSRRPVTVAGSDPDAALSPTVLFVHGNAGNLGSHLGGVYWLPSRGYNVFLFDYRGFGRSDGKADLPGAYEDTRAALRAVAARADVDRERLFLLGQSIGAAVALPAAASLREEIALRALVIDSAPSDFRDIAREKLGSFWLTWPLQWPLSLTIPGRPRPLDAVAVLDGTRILYLHGAADEIVPLHHTQRLAAAGGASQIIVVDGADHVQALAEEWVRDRVVEFFAASAAPPRQ